MERVEVDSERARTRSPRSAGGPARGVGFKDAYGATLTTKRVFQQIGQKLGQQTCQDAVAYWKLSGMFADIVDHYGVAAVEDAAAEGHNGGKAGGKNQPPSTGKQKYMISDMVQVQKYFKNKKSYPTYVKSSGIHRRILSLLSLHLAVDRTLL